MTSCMHALLYQILYEKQGTNIFHYAKIEILFLPPDFDYYYVMWATYNVRGISCRESDDFYLMRLSY